MWGSGSGHAVSDSNLSSGFPLKSTDTVKQGTFCCWYYTWPWFGSSPTAGVIMGKKSYGGASGSFDLCIKSDATLSIEWNSAGTLETFPINFTLVDGVWYHFGLAIDGIAKTCVLRIYDSLADSSTTFSVSPSGEMGLTCLLYTSDAADE